MGKVHLHTQMHANYTHIGHKSQFLELSPIPEQMWRICNNKATTDGCAFDGAAEKGRCDPVWREPTPQVLVQSRASQEQFSQRFSDHAHWTRVDPGDSDQPTLKLSLTSASQRCCSVCLPCLMPQQSFLAPPPPPQWFKALEYFRDGWVCIVGFYFLNIFPLSVSISPHCLSDSPVASKVFWAHCRSYTAATMWQVKLLHLSNNPAVCTEITFRPPPYTSCDTITWVKRLV